MAEGGHPHKFRSTQGRGEINPYVEKLGDWAPVALDSEAAEGHRGHWRERIGVPPSAPLHLEIGPGNGFFLRDLAAREQGAAIVAVEIRFKRVWLAAKKSLEAGHRHVRVVHHHAGYLTDLFEPGELDRIWLNHPDPWPKDRHHKHRLLQPAFVETLRSLIRTGGEFWLKSDFQPYGPLAEALFTAPAWTPIASTADLHGGDSPLRATNIQTNYERKKRAEGLPILVAGFRAT